MPRHRNHKSRRISQASGLPNGRSTANYTGPAVQDNFGFTGPRPPFAWPEPRPPLMNQETSMQNGATQWQAWPQQGGQSHWHEQPMQGSNMFGDPFVGHWNPPGWNYMNNGHSQHHDQSGHFGYNTPFINSTAHPNYWSNGHLLVPPFAPFAPTAPRLAPRGSDQPATKEPSTEGKSRRLVRTRGGKKYAQKPQCTTEVGSVPAEQASASVPTARAQSPILDILTDSGASTPVPFARRKKWARATGAPPPPTDDYLAISMKPPVSLRDPHALPPPQLILDLNNTLLCRLKTGNNNRKFYVRPYAATFLQYACGADKSGRRLFDTIVYSSAASHNVLRLLMGLRLVPLDRATWHQRNRRSAPWDSRPGEALKLVWTRENLHLTPEEFVENVETVKNLSEIWEERPGSGPERTILLDDEAGKAAQQPYNHVPILPFIIDPESVQHRDEGVDERQSKARELPVGHTYYDDTSLLSAIYVLDRLRVESNVAAFVRQRGLVDGLDVKSERERVMAGVEICEKLEIPITRDWDDGWWSKTRKGR